MGSFSVGSYGISACSPEANKLHGDTGGRAGQGGVGFAGGGTLPDGSVPACAADSGCSSCAALGCSNTDPNHCGVGCEGSCTVVAKDADGDGHGDALCAAAPGDDCNDHDATVFPGAPELCDGLDNDCNGFADSMDTLPLGGQLVTLSTDLTTGSVGLVASGEEFAALRLDQDWYASWTAAPPSPQYAESQTLFRFSGTAMKRTDIGSVSPLRPTIGVSGNQLLNIGDGRLLTPAAQRVSLDTGVGTGSTTFLGSTSLGAAVTDGPNGSWVVAWGNIGSTPPALNIGRLSADGVMGIPFVAPAAPGTTPTIVSIAHGRDSYAVTWVDVTRTSNTQSKLTVRWMLLDTTASSEFASGVFDEIPDPMNGDFVSTIAFSNPRIQVVATTDGYVFAWFDARNRLQIERLDAHGATVCGPVPVESAVSWAFSNSLIATETGVIAAINDRASLGRLVGIDTWCTVNPHQPILNQNGTHLGVGLPPPAGNTLLLGQPVIARAPDGRVAASWIEQNPPDGGVTSAYRTMARIMSAKLCN